MLYAIVAVLALILDQAVKYWTTVHIVVDTGRAELIPGLIHLSNVHNTGAAFSFLQGARWFFVILCIVFVLIVVYALAKELITHPVCRWSAVFVMAGAIGNCIDRIVCGYVVDMLEFDFRFFKRPFPVFNVADIFITLGVIVFCIALLLEKPKQAEKSQKAPSAAAAEAQPKTPREKKPLIRRRQKIEIPVFEKHDLPDIPEMDPNDPFAEWEKRANAPAAQPAEPQAASPVTPPHTEYSQPSQASAPVDDSTPIPIPMEMPDVTAVPEARNAPKPPVASLSDAPTVEVPDTSAASSSGDEFDLDSILSEFRDL